MYDLIIIGAGPAGITAAIYAARKKMNFIVVTKDIGGQVTRSWEIENYTGYQYLTGGELTQKFEEHVKKFNVDIKEEEVIWVGKTNNFFTVKTGSGVYQAKTIIIASGRKPKELGVPGERKFRNRGVTYCATCDAPLFAGKDVAVIGGGNSGLEAVLQLMRIANKIYLIEAGPELKADDVLKEKAMDSGEVRIMTNARVMEILGNMLVTGIKVRDQTGEKLLSVQGVFIEIGSTPNSGIVGIVEKNEFGEIKVNCKCQTNVPGLFAAGDVTNVPEKQIIVAAGEGCKAVLSAFEYLSRIK